MAMIGLSCHLPTLSRIIGNQKPVNVTMPAGDEPTADLLTQRMQVHEKTAWMLRSLLQEQKA
jgi:DNA-binding ferritin-like protein